MTVRFQVVDGRFWFFSAKPKSSDLLISADLLPEKLHTMDFFLALL
jgi:hypothetical protein